uniref:ATP-binding protein n=1 Tax=Thermofilum pendens TaxID=2269 RepID=A0A7C4BBA5_THEPE
MEVRTRKLSRGEALNFLERGFAEAGMKVDREKVEAAVEELDGIIGWLTYCGYLRVGERGDLGRVVEEAVELARSEFESFPLQGSAGGTGSCSSRWLRAPGSGGG